MMSKRKETVLIEENNLDYNEYVDHLKDSYSELLSKYKFSESFMNQKYYKWKYNTPDGYGRIAGIFDGTRIVSSAGIIPVAITYQKLTIKGWQVVDLATRPEYRNKGYLRACIHALMELQKDNEIFYVFPNKDSISAFRKLGWSTNLIVSTWLKPIIMDKRYHSCIIKINKFDSGNYHLRDKFTNIAKPMIKRNVDYLNWRYSNHPNVDYRIFAYQDKGETRGYCVVRKANVLMRNFALIMELWSEGAKIRKYLLDKITNWAKFTGIKILVFMSSGLSFLEGSDVGLIPVPSFVLPKRQVLVMRAVNDNLKVLTKNEWDIQAGDWDVF